MASCIHTRLQTWQLTAPPWTLLPELEPNYSHLASTSSPRLLRLNHNIAVLPSASRARLFLNAFNLAFCPTIANIVTLVGP